MAWQGARGLPTDWGRRRRAVLERDGYRCQRCGRHAPGNPPRSSTDRRGVLEVDHIGHRDDHRLENLRVLCYRCHAPRTAAQGNAAQRPRRGTDRPLEDHPGIISR